MKLKSSKRAKPKEKYSITKTGRVIRDRKLITPIYEKKYSHKIVQSYSMDKRERLHDKKGRFVTKQTQQKYSELIDVSKKRTDRRLKKKDVTTTRTIKKGRFMASNFALTYECVCYIEEGITTHEEDKYGRTITHYYTISSPEYITNSDAKNKHDRHYPTHTLIHIQHTSTKVLSFD